MWKRAIIPHSSSLRSGVEQLRRNIAKDESGQSALFDAVMFLVIMIMASGLIQVFSSQYSQDVDIIEREDMQAYMRDTAEVVFGATLRSTWYEDAQGQIINKPPGDTTVLNLILEELYLLDNGVPKENFALGYEKDIKILARNLMKSPYHFAMEGRYAGEDNNVASTVFISDTIPDYSTKDEARLDETDYAQLIPKSNLASTRISMPMIVKSGEAEITFSIWR